MIQLRDNIWAVEVPEDAFNFCINQSNELGYYANIEYFDKMHYRSLPPGAWQIVCTSKEVTEGHAAEVVNSSTWYFPTKHTRYVDYACPFDREFKQRWSEGFGEATKSLASLLAVKGCDVNKNYLILKKQ